MNRWLILGCAGGIALSGCSPARRDENREKLWKSEQRAVTQQRALNQQADELRKTILSLSNTVQDLQGTVLKMQLEQEELQNQLAAREAEIQVLTQLVEKARIHLARFRGQPAPTIGSAPSARAASSLEARRADFIHAPVGTEPDLFPVDAYNLIGRRVVSGSHREWRKDSSSVSLASSRGGHVVGERDSNWDTVKDVEQQAVYSLRNLTRTPKTVRVRTSIGSANHVLEAGATLDGQAVRAARGDRLTLEVAGESRSYDVPY